MFHNVHSAAEPEHDSVVVCKLDQRRKRQRKRPLVHADDVPARPHRRNDVGHPRFAVGEVGWGALEHHLGVDVLDHLQRVELAAALFIGAGGALALLCI